MIEELEVITVRDTLCPYCESPLEPDGVFAQGFCKKCQRYVRFIDKAIAHLIAPAAKRKLAMWIACCGCNNAQSLFQNIYRTETNPLRYYTKCPYCGYEHEIIVRKS